MPWKDVSSFSKSTKDRTPNSWEIKLGIFRLSVHRHIKYDDKQWLVSCYGVCENHSLEAVDIDDAKVEALKFLQETVQASLDAIIKELS